jgi:hypothetical protein
MRLILAGRRDLARHDDILGEMMPTAAQIAAMTDRVDAIRREMAR